MAHPLTNPSWNYSADAHLVTLRLSDSSAIVMKWAGYKILHGEGMLKSAEAGARRSLTSGRCFFAESKQVSQQVIT